MLGVARHEEGVVQESVVNGISGPASLESTVPRAAVHEEGEVQSDERGLSTTQKVTEEIDVGEEDLPDYEENSSDSDQMPESQVCKRFSTSCQ